MTITKEEYLKLKEKTEFDTELLLKFVRGLEDIRAGRIKPWDEVVEESID